MISTVNWQFVQNFQSLPTFLKYTALLIHCTIASLLYWHEVMDDLEYLKHIQKAKCGDSGWKSNGKLKIFILDTHTVDNFTSNFG